MNDELIALRKRAESVIANINQNPPERPIFVEFSGSPKSGKSTCIDIVGHFFRRLNFRILAPTEGASKRTPYYLRDDLVAFNTWSASYALTHVLEGSYHSDKYHLAILDRGLFDALAWFELLANQNEMSSEDCTRVQEFLLIEKWRSVIDTVFLFKADPSTSLNRENRDKLLDEPGRAMNPNFLNDLNSAYDTVRTKYADKFPHFNVIDTSSSEGSTPKSTAAKVVSLILDLFPQEQL